MVKFEQARNWVIFKFVGIDDWKRKYAAYVNSRKPHGPKNRTSQQPLKSFLLWLRDEFAGYYGRSGGE